MPCDVFLTETAISDFKKIALDILDVSKDKETARSFVAELEAQVERLKDFPLCGALPADRNLVCRGYRFLVHKDFLIFYTFEETKNAVYVQAAFHAGLDYKRVLRTL